MIYKGILLLFKSRFSSLKIALLMGYQQQISRGSASYRFFIKDYLKDYNSVVPETLGIIGLLGSTQAKYTYQTSEIYLHASEIHLLKNYISLKTNTFKKFATIF